MTEARTPDAIYADASSRRAGRHAHFLKQCLRNIAIIDFAHHGTGRVYARIVGGKLVAWNPDIYRLAVRDDDVRAVFEAIAMPPKVGPLGALGADDRLDPRHHLTLGEWGDE